MRKTSDISKYDLDWQMRRVSLKSLPSVDAKVKSAIAFLRDHPTQADNERVRNYLEGLAMAYKGDVRDAINAVADSLEGKKYKVYNRLDFNPGDYSSEDIKILIKDLLQRSKVWLSKGYHHKEHEKFLWDLIKYSKDKAAAAKFQKMLDDAPDKNTHAFFF